jgi:PLP dependent protein
MDAARVAANVREVRDRIAAACARAGRGDDVTIVAVTKTHGPAAALAAAAAGLGDCGENRVQELEAKRTAVGGVVAWHLIGHLQRNKVRRALPLIDRMHAVDSARLAEALSAEAAVTGVRLPALVQVNVFGEDSKGGFEPGTLIADLSRVCSLPGLSVDGLMTMAPFTEDEAVLRRTFGALRRLSERCAAEVSGYTAKHLSMGMSNDYELAVEEGATMVRLGTVLFGERTAP